MPVLKAKVGDSISFSKTISESDVYLFAGLIGDFYEIHLNREYAAKTPMGRQIAHGVLVLGLASTVATNIQKKYEYGTPAVLYGYDKLRFVKPVFFGDTLTATQTVSEVDEASGKMVSKVEIVNQRNETVLAALCIQKFVQ